MTSVWSPERSWTRGFLTVLAGFLTASATQTSVAQSQDPVQVGPYRFRTERLFSMTATASLFDENVLRDRRVALPMVPPLVEPPPTLSMDDVLAGYSPNYALVQLGNPDCTVPCYSTPGCPLPERLESVTYTFDPDFLPYEGRGPDVILFEYVASLDDQDVAIRPAGGTFTPRIYHPGNQMVPTGRALGNRPMLPIPVPEIYALELDFADFGLPLGTPVEEVRIYGDCQTNPWTSGDPIMAAAVDRLCNEGACPDDGDPCTIVQCQSGTCVTNAAPAGTPCPGGTCDGGPFGRCLGCLSDADCGGDAPRCDTDRGQCVACLDAADCTSAENECLAGACSEGECRYEDPRPRGSACSGGFCDGASDPRCLECLADQDCSEPRPLCALLDGRCVECRTESDCPSGPCFRPLCDATGMCREVPVTGPGCERDAGTTQDLGLTTDAGSTGGDAAAPDAAGTGGSLDPGCGCRTHGSEPPWTPALLLALVAVLRRSLRPLQARLR